MPNEINLSKRISEKKVLDCVNKNYGQLHTAWIEHQMNWVTMAYNSFKDHEKYLILVVIVEKTFQTYNQNAIRFTYEEYFSKNQIQIESFNIIEISKALQLPKESVRRKVKELENLGVIKRIKKKIVLDRNAFNFVEPIIQIKKTSQYISRIAHFLYKDKLIEKEINPELVEGKVKENFTSIWILFYKMQISMTNTWSEIFGDMACFHVWGTCVTNQSYNVKSSNNTVLEKLNRAEINSEIVNLSSTKSGINAMSISDLTGIPRATVIRKLNILLKNQSLLIDKKKKHYFLTGKRQHHLQEMQEIIFKHKAVFISKIINHLILSH
jgi:predicted transcriptional regulator